MLAPIRLLLLVFAFVCFVLSAVGAQVPHVNLQSAGLACWIATLFF